MNPKVKVLLFSQDERLLNGVPKRPQTGVPAFVVIHDVSDLIAKVYDEMPHVVVADIRQSDIGALEIVSQMQKDVVLGYIPLILLTDTARWGQRIDCGADLYLEKPVPWKEILYHVERVVAESHHELDVNPLTNLPGNRSTVRKLEEVLKRSSPFAVAYIDLKGLNYYNVAYGVSRGDFLIRETSIMIQEAVRRKVHRDTFVGHLGGDDFIVITTPGTCVTIAEVIIGKFDESVHRFYGRSDREKGYMILRDEKGNYQHYPFVTMSIAILDNEVVPYRHVSELSKTATEIHDYLKQFPVSSYLRDRRKLLRDAHGGMESLGILGATSIRKRDSVGAWGKRADILSRVSGIIQRKDVKTCYQEIFDAQTKEMIGYEALSRFQNGEATLIDATEMFHQAREANLIRPFDVLCAQKALENARDLPPPYKLFININRETLVERESMDMILRDSQVPLKRIVLELTEQSLLPATGVIASAIEGLRTEGLELAIDDIGGGSVSLRDVAFLKPDYMKFDRSLIRGIQNDTVKQKILVSLIVFAKGIRAKTTAEGIETAGEFHWIRRSGIDYAQGYYLSRPSTVNFKKIGRGERLRVEEQDPN